MGCPNCGGPVTVTRTMLGGYNQVRCMTHGRAVVKGPTGEELRDAGMAEVGSLPADAPWRVVARAELERLAASGEPFTAEDVTAKVGLPQSVNSVGALFGAAAKQGMIEQGGWAHTERASRDASQNRIWRGKR